MAGARLGFAIADAGIIADLEKIKYSTNPYNINRLTLLSKLRELFLQVADISLLQ